MTDFEKQCYGMSVADIRKEYMEGLTARVSGLEMVVGNGCDGYPVRCSGNVGHGSPRSRSGEHEHS